LIARTKVATAGEKRRPATVTSETSQEREAIFVAGVRGAGAPGEGRGLGLAIAREIAEECGGTLTLDAAGPGACFRLRLPLAPALDAPRAA
jgi:signal transduction histidine kinase